MTFNPIEFQKQAAAQQAELYKQAAANQFDEVLAFYNDHLQKEAGVKEGMGKALTAIKGKLGAAANKVKANPLASGAAAGGVAGAAGGAYAADNPLIGALLGGAGGMALGAGGAAMTPAGLDSLALERVRRMLSGPTGSAYGPLVG